jgi:predicted RNA-binding Zn-ribbon protein involved in translation (DUF1610 family)
MEHWVEANTPSLTDYRIDCPVCGYKMEWRKETMSYRKWVCPECGYVEIKERLWR